MNCSGSEATHRSARAGEILLADPVADEGQLLELADRLGELLGELLHLGDRSRGEHGHEDGGDSQHPRPDDGDGDAAVQS